MASLSSSANTIIGNTTTAYDAVYALIYDKSAWLRQSGQSWLITRARIRFGDVLSSHIRKRVWRRRLFRLISSGARGADIPFALTSIDFRPDNRRSSDILKITRLFVSNPKVDLLYQ